jgi:hypothetical protein
LRLKRLRFARRVFLRHALPEWRLWNSPRAFAGAYRAVLDQYYDYFTEAAIARADRGETQAALGAVTGALRVFPVRGAYHLVLPRPLRSAFLRALLPGPRASG